jgi:hypothetical protein
LAAELEEQRRAAQAREDQTRFRAAVQVQAVFIRLEVGHRLCFDEVADPCAAIFRQHIMRDCAALRTRSEIEAKVGVFYCPQLGSYRWARWYGSHGCFQYDRQCISMYNVSWFRSFQVMELVTLCQQSPLRRFEDTTFCPGTQAAPPTETSSPIWVPVHHIVPNPRLGLQEEISPHDPTQVRHSTSLGGLFSHALVSWPLDSTDHVTLVVIVS